MLRILTLLSLLGMTGCMTVAAYIPSVQTCQHVKYERHYSLVTVTMDCDLLHDGLTP